MLVTFQGTWVCWIPCGWDRVCGHPVLGQRCSVYLMGVSGYPVVGLKCSGYPMEGLGMWEPDGGAEVCWIPCGWGGMCR